MYPMTSLKHRQNGFTIIELLIVVIVIGILATLVFTTFSGVERNNRNKDRETDIKDLLSQVEFYYGQNNKYPTLANLNDATWRTANLKGFDTETLKDPSGSESILVSNPTAGAYSYVVTPTDCNNAGVDCTGYTLTATNEGEGQFVRNSLNN